MADSAALARQAWERVYLDPVHAGELARQAVRAGGAGAGMAWLATALLEVRGGDAALGAEAVAAARALFRAAGDRRGLSLCDEVRAIALRRAGRLDAALRLQRAIDTATGLGRVAGAADIDPVRPPCPADGDDGGEGDEGRSCADDEALSIDLADTDAGTGTDADARAGGVVDTIAFTSYDRFIAHNSRAITHKMLGDADAALRQFYAASDAAGASGVTGARITALCNLGGLHQDLFNLDDARALSEQALLAAREAGAWPALATAAANLIVSHHAAGQRDEAHAMALFLVAQRPTLGHAALRRLSLPLALGYLAGGDIATAQQHLDRSVGDGAAEGDGAPFRAWLQARCWLAAGDAHRARCVAEEALAERAERAGHGWCDPPYDLMELHRAAADACERTGDLAAALACVKRAHALYEQLVGRSAQARFIAVQAAHELARAHRERDLAIDSQRSSEHDRRRLAQLNAALRTQIDQTAMLHAKLSEQALRDPLTGLHNRRYLFEVAPGLLERARRDAAPLCVGLLDLDHFKLLNDTFGHHAGDAVLQRFATLMSEMLRRSDIVCRYGGEEFVAVMPDMDAAGADAMLRRLLEAYRQPHDLGEKRLPSCSFSAGIAIFPAHGLTLEQLLRRADRGLYKAKNLGRARIERAPSSEFSTLP